MYGSDAKHSMEPDEFRLLAESLRETWAMVSHPINKNDVTAYQEMKTIFQKSIVTARALTAGTVLEKVHLTFKKPGDGIPAAQYASVLGRKLSKTLPENHKLVREDLL